MSYSEETMNRISQALAGGALASTGADRGADTSGESQDVRERFLNEPSRIERACFRIEDTCCGKCPVGTTCYVDQITGA